MASFVGRITCAICQGDNHCDYCVLACGHPYHVVCIETWIENKASCPICRDKVNRRSIRPLVGCETVADVSAGGSQADELLQQQLATKQQQLELLHQQLEENEQKVQQLSQTVCQLADQQERLQQKLSDAKNKCAELEQQRRADSKRLSAAAAEKDKLQEKYYTDMQRLQLQLRDEQSKQRRAAADLKRLQLTNPQLALADIRDIVGPDQEQMGQPALAAILAQRNAQLQASEAAIQKLQQQLIATVQGAEQRAQSLVNQHQEQLQQVEQDKELHLKESLALDYKNSKLKVEKDSLVQQLQELQGVLQAIEQGDGAGRRQQPQSHAVPDQQQQQSCPRGARHVHQQRPVQPWKSSYTSRGSACSRDQSGKAGPSLVCAAAFLANAGHAAGSSHACASEAAANGPSQGVSAPSASCHQDSLSDVLEVEDSGQEVEHGCGQQQAAEGQAQPQHQQPSKHQEWRQQQHCYDQNAQPMYQHEKEASWLGHGRPANSSAKAAHKHSPAAVGASTVTAALGPGSLLQLLQGVKHGPSFVPKTHSSAMPSMAGCVTGSVIRHGPDGRGSTAAFLASSSETTKRAPESNFNGLISSKRLKTVVGASKPGIGKAAAQTGITAYFKGRY